MEKQTNQENQQGQADQLAGRQAGHTPGPWRVEEESGDMFIYAHPYEYDVSIGMAFRPARDLLEDRPTGEHKSNARLIAAAPDLLAACQSLVELWAEWAKDSGLLLEPLRRSIEMRLEEANLAIAKAGGQA